MLSENVISPSRTYIAICNKSSFDGHYFKEFKLPEEYENNSRTATWYFLNILDFVSCVDGCFTAEDFKNVKYAVLT